MCYTILCFTLNAVFYEKIDISFAIVDVYIAVVSYGWNMSKA